MFEPNKPLKLLQHKHEFMYKEVPEIAPSTFDDIIETNVTSLKFECSDYEIIPACPVEYVDITRSKEAFGRPSLRMLWRQLWDSNLQIKRQALERLSLVLHDPEKCFEAIRINTIARLQPLCTQKEDFMRERCAMILLCLVQMDRGRESFMSNLSAVYNLKIMIQDYHFNVRLKSNEVLELLAFNFFAAKVLIDYEFLPIVINNIIEDEENEIVRIHLDILKSLLQTDAKEEAIDLGALPALMQIIMTFNDDTCSKAEGCLALLMEHAKGKEMAVYDKFLPMLADKLFSEDERVVQKAAACVMNITHTTPSKTLAFQMGLHVRLLDLAKSFRNQELQINCVKALTNISEVPEAREEVLKKKSIIENIPTAEGKSESLKRHIKTLINSIDFKI